MPIELCVLASGSAGNCTALRTPAGALVGEADAALACIVQIERASALVLSDSSRLQVPLHLRSAAVAMAQRP